MDSDRAPVPSKLTPELQVAICEGLKLGMPIVHVCNSVGISSQTFRRWRKAGRIYDDAIYVDFVAAIKKAKADFISDNMANIRDKSSDAWQASAWLLERREPASFGKKEVEQLHELQKELAALKAVIADRVVPNENRA